jgi:hypothetical protein
VQLRRKGLGLASRLLKRFSSGFLVFNGSKRSFQPFGELLARRTGHPFDPFFHATVRSNGETNRALGHSTYVRCGAI